MCTHANSTHSEALAAFLNAQPNGVVVAVVAADEASRSLTPNAVAAIQKIGSFLITKIQYRSGFVSIGIH